MPSLNMDQELIKHSFYVDLIVLLERYRDRVVVGSGQRLDDKETDLFFVPVPENFWQEFAKPIGLLYLYTLDNLRLYQSQILPLNEQLLQQFSRLYGNLEWVLNGNSSNEDVLGATQTVVISLRKLIPDFLPALDKATETAYMAIASKLPELFPSIVRKLPKEVLHLAANSEYNWNVFLPLLNFQGDNTFVPGSSTSNYRALMTRVFERPNKTSDFINNMFKISPWDGYFVVFRDGVKRTENEAADAKIGVKSWDGADAIILGSHIMGTPGLTNLRTVNDLSLTFNKHDLTNAYQALTIQESKVKQITRSSDHSSGKRPSLAPMKRRTKKTSILDEVDDFNGKETKKEKSEDSDDTKLISRRIRRPIRRSPSDDVDILPRHSPSNSPQRSRSNSPQRSRSNSPQRSRSNSPQRSRSNSPQRSRSNSPQRIIPQLDYDSE